jgi:hypothetical protein
MVGTGTGGDVGKGEASLGERVGAGEGTCKNTASVGWVTIQEMKPTSASDENVKYPHPIRKIAPIQLLQL